MIAPQDLVDSSLEWLKENYPHFPFVVERDIVWTLQKHMNSEIKSTNLPYSVFTDYPMLQGQHRSLCADLVVLDSQDSVAVAMEFKYEPSRDRPDILKSKFPVVFWGENGVGKDVKRIHEYVEKGKARIAISLFIDEVGSFAHRNPHPNSCWIDWGNSIRVLYARVERNL
jgi:hypothetical protein